MRSCCSTVAGGVICSLVQKSLLSSLKASSLCSNWTNCAFFCKKSLTLRPSFLRTKRLASSRVTSIPFSKRSCWTFSSTAFVFGVRIFPFFCKKKPPPIASVAAIPTPSTTWFVKNPTTIMAMIPTSTIRSHDWNCPVCPCSP